MLQGASYKWDELGYVECQEKHSYVCSSLRGRCTAPPVPNPSFLLPGLRTAVSPKGPPEEVEDSKAYRHTRERTPEHTRTRVNRRSASHHMHSYLGASSKIEIRVPGPTALADRSSNHSVVAASQLRWVTAIPANVAALWHGLGPDNLGCAKATAPGMPQFGVVYRTAVLLVVSLVLWLPVGRRQPEVASKVE